PVERQRAGDADGRRLRQGLSLVAEELILRRCVETGALQNRILSFASIGLRSVCSPSIVRISISIRRAMNEIGTSLEPPSNGFEEFSPTFSSERKSQPTIALNGTFNHTVQCAMPADFPRSCA